VALIDGGKRSADVTALTDVVCYRLTLGAIAGAESGVRLQLVEALAHDLAERLRRANEEIAILAS
jgi:CRP-like cAMP-binding protein